MSISTTTNKPKSVSSSQVATHAPVQHAPAAQAPAKTTAAKPTPTIATDHGVHADQNQFRQTGKENHATAPQHTPTSTQKQQAASAEMRDFSKAAPKASSASTAKLASAVNQGGLVKNGSSGPAVTELQKNLSKLGFNCAADGDFGPKTKAALQQFQKQQGIPADGVFGPQSLGQMQKALSGGKSTPETAPHSTPSKAAPETARHSAPSKTAPETSKQAPAGGVGATGKVAPSSMSEAQKYEHYKSIIEANGGKVSGKPGERQMLGLRKETNTHANGNQGVYDDTMAMLWKDSNGQPHVREYKANTEPSARYDGKMGTDANGDGRLDQGRLPVGNYKYGFSSYHGGPALRMIGDAKVDRDTNHDGLFNDGKQTMGGASMLFHPGGNNMTGSAGCQTMPPAEFNRFWADLTRDGKSSYVNYTIANA